MEISNILKNVTVVDSKKSKNEIGMGSVLIAKTGQKEKQFTIVSFNEADPMEGKISNESPLGLAFLGKKKDEEVVVRTPKGEVKYKILKIE